MKKSIIPGICAAIWFANKLRVSIIYYPIMLLEIKKIIEGSTVYETLNAFSTPIHGIVEKLHFYAHKHTCKNCS